MKKRTLGAGVLTAMMLFSPIAGNSVDASTLAEAKLQQSTQKFMWGANELYDSQMGRLVFTKDVKVYKKVGNSEVKFHMNAKKGSMWRVYKITDEGGKKVYDLGAGVRVQQSNLSKYETPPKDLVAKQVKQNGAFLSWEHGNGSGHSYPQVRKLASESVKNKINNHIKERAIQATHSGDVLEDMEIKVLENKNNTLTVYITATISDSEIGNVSTSEYTYEYNLTTGDVTVVEIQ